MATDQTKDIEAAAIAHDLTGRVAVVTGAAGGIGAATARLLARAGAQVIGVDANPAIADLDEPGCFAEVLDVTSQKAVEALIERTVERFGRLDIMVNNAAVISNNVVADLEEAELDRIISVNLKGVFFGCKAAAAVMTRQGGGAIINLASDAIHVASPPVVAYAMTKAAVAQLTKCLAMEVGPSNVRVNAVAPGFIETPMTSRHFTSDDGAVDQDKRKEVIGSFTQGKVINHIGQPVDIAHTILFLASDASRNMTGQIIRSNGGGTMP
ncbi:MAG: SDR family oxidoreductase [Sphingomonadaceae bacterium]|nr:SDR family oxidoreductase [Sphingomonadaceae bacterium]